eukprot:2434582-Pleurochrysis_carterae.AAC.1
MSCVFTCRPSCKCMLCSVGVCSMYMVILLLLFETRWLRLSMKAAAVVTAATTDCLASQPQSTEK